jgi:hypothetical protein
MSRNLTLTRRQVATLNRFNAAYNREVAEMPRYPVVDYQTLIGMPQALAGHGPNGFVAKESMLGNLGWTQHALDAEMPKGFDLTDLGIGLGTKQFHRGRHDKRRQGKGKGKSKGGGGRDRALMNPQVVHGLIKKAIAASGLKPVGLDGPIVRAVHNFEFLTGEKAAWFIDALAEIIPLAHIWSCAEVTEEGIKKIAERTGYEYVVSVENNRGQAVAVMWDPRRVQKVDTWSIDEVANVQNVNDLRPVIGVDLIDKSPKTKPLFKKFWAASGHMKSMRGGEEASGIVRHLQNQLAAAGLKDRGAGALGMDSNSKLATDQGDWETSPLTDSGLLLVGPDDHRATQTMMSRLDGLWARGFDHVLLILDQLNWFEDPQLGRGLTDHGALITA